MISAKILNTRNKSSPRCRRFKFLKTNRTRGMWRFCSKNLTLRISRSGRNLKLITTKNSKRTSNSLHQAKMLTQSGNSVKTWRKWLRWFRRTILIKQSTLRSLYSLKSLTTDTTSLEKLFWQTTSWNRFMNLYRHGITKALRLKATTAAAQAPSSSSRTIKNTSLRQCRAVNSNSSRVSFWTNLQITFKWRRILYLQRHLAFSRLKPSTSTKRRSLMSFWWKDVPCCATLICSLMCSTWKARLSIGR